MREEKPGSLGGGCDTRDAAPCGNSLPIPTAAGFGVGQRSATPPLCTASQHTLEGGSPPLPRRMQSFSAPSSPHRQRAAAQNPDPHLAAPDLSRKRNRGAPPERPDPPPSSQPMRGTNQGPHRNRRQRHSPRLPPPLHHRNRPDQSPTQLSERAGASTEARTRRAPLERAPGSKGTSTRAEGLSENTRGATRPPRPLGPPGGPSRGGCGDKRALQHAPGAPQPPAIPAPSTLCAASTT